MPGLILSVVNVPWASVLPLKATLPLASDNLGRAVGPDGRLRVRLDISTTLTQFDATRQLCEKLPIPLCTGAGLVNPIPFPPSLSNPLGISGAARGGGG